MRMYKWPSIDQFHTVKHNVDRYPHLCGDSLNVSYRPKIKLDGTNGAVVLTKDLIYTQSRNRILTGNVDNYDFNYWVYSNLDFWKTIFEKNNKELVIFGEWSGAGVNNRTAVAQLPNRIFTIFACHELGDDSDKLSLIVEPVEIKDIILDNPDLNIFVLPWLDDDIIDVNWTLSYDELLPVTDNINKKVLEVEKQDPFIFDKFGISGIGEGLVYYPVSGDHSGRYYFSNLGFKAKGELHQVVRQKNAAQAKPETFAQVTDLVDAVLSENRLVQGCKEVNKSDTDIDIRKLGEFLKWVCGDIRKECKAEIIASGFDWKAIGKILSTKARDWYLKRLGR